MGVDGGTCCTRQNGPFDEIIMSAPEADKVLPAFHPLLLDGPVPEGGAPQALRDNTKSWNG